MIQSSLMAQHIISRVKQIDLMKDAICIIKITDETDINSAIDFIWKSKNRSWSYSVGETQKSFKSN